MPGLAPTPAPPAHHPDLSLGVFETMLVIDGRPVELDAHLARLEASRAVLFPGRTPIDPRQEILDLATTANAGCIRLTTTASETLVSLFETKRALGSIALHSFPVAGGLGGHKWADRRLLDAAQASLPADTLPLIVDRDGAVLEASRANVFAVRDGALLTPPTDGRILPGVTRARLLEIAGAMGVEAREAELSREDLLGAEEVFLTGSVRGVERVGALDGSRLAGEGEIAARLGAELRRSWAGAAQVG